MLIIVAAIIIITIVFKKAIVPKYYPEIVGKPVSALAYVPLIALIFGTGLYSGKNMTLEAMCNIDSLRDISTYRSVLGKWTDIIKAGQEYGIIPEIEQSREMMDLIAQSQFVSWLWAISGILLLTFAVLAIWNIIQKGRFSKTKIELLYWVSVVLSITAFTFSTIIFCKAYSYVHIASGDSTARIVCSAIIELVIAAVVFVFYKKALGNLYNTTDNASVSTSETLSENQNDNYKEGSTNESATTSTIKNNETDKSLIIVAIAVLTIVAGIISFRAIQTHRIKKMIEAEIEATEVNETVEEANENGAVSLERVIELFESIPDHEQVNSSSRSAMTADLYNTLLIAWDVPDNAEYISMIGNNEFLYYFVSGQDPSPIIVDKTTIINSDYKDETHCTIEIGFFYERYDERQKMLLYLVKGQGSWMLDDFSSIYSNREHNEYFIESQKKKCSEYINSSITDWINGIPQNQILNQGNSNYDKVQEFNSEFDAFFKTYPSMKELADNIKKSSQANWKTTEYGFKVPNNMVSNDYIWVDDALGEYMSWTNGDVQLLLWPDLPSWSVEEGFPSKDTYLSSNVKVKSITYSNSTKDIFSGYASDGRIWYLKKIFLEGDVAWHTDCLFLLYPKTEQNNVSELIEEVKNWGGR